MRGIWRYRRTVAIAIGALVALTLAPSAASAADRYTIVNNCYGLRSVADARFVVKDATGYAATATTVGGATPFRMQATALGRYLLYGPDAQMPSVGVLNQVTPTSTPGRPADWRVTGSGAAFKLHSVANDLGLATGLARRLVLVPAAAAATFQLVPTTGCATFPEIETSTTGTPPKGASPTARVRGFLDDHNHISAFQFLGGRFHCGRPWSPYGVTVALKDCADHEPNGAGATFENFLATGSPVGTHDTGGWPTFAGWPRDESLTHEGTYWKWLERGWRGGVRIIVNDLVENRALCELYPLKKNNCDEMASARLQAQDMYDLQDYVDAQNGGPGKGWLRIVRNPTQARSVINDGKLAMVLGLETSEPFGCGQFLDQPKCTTAQIDQQLAEFHALGVRSAFPVHKFDNALGGTHFDSGGSGVLVNAGNKYATGKFWEAEQCPGPDSENVPTNPFGEYADEMYTLLGPVLASQILSGQAPVYPPPPICNPRGLTALGRYTIRAMIRRGMIVETDHLSVKARREALTILENQRYPGVISSHTWGDAGSQKRLQTLGGVVGPITEEANEFAAEWREARANRDPRFFFGIGFGADTNGLHAQPPARPGAAQNPVQYPFRSFDGNVVLRKQRSGSRTYDINTDGVDHYGLHPDWVEDLRKVAGNQIVTDLANGAEAYLQMWQRAVSHQAP